MKKMKFRPKLKQSKERDEGWKEIYFMKDGHLIKIWRCGK